jgi:hypothetical protein
MTGYGSALGATSPSTGFAPSGHSECAGDDPLRFAIGIVSIPSLSSRFFSNSRETCPVRRHTHQNICSRGYLGDRPRLVLTLTGI